MTIGGEVKLLGDHYAGGFSCGLTMGDSGTMERFQLVRESGNEIVYQSEEDFSAEAWYYKYES